MTVQQQTAQRHAARGTMQVLVGQACFFLFGYPVAILLARGLGPEIYGVYGVILSVLLWTEHFSRLGLPSAAAKLIAEDQQRAPQVERTACVLSLVIFCGIFGIFWLSAPVLARLFHIPDGVWLFRLAAVDIPFYGMYFFYRGVSTGRRNFGMLSLGEVMYALSKLIGILGLWLFGLSVAGALVINVLGSVVGLGFFVSRIRLGGWEYDRATAALLIPLALPLAMSFLGEGLFHHLDLWCLKALLPGDTPEAVGVYVAASQLAKPIPQLSMMAVSVVLFPSISRALAHQDKALAQRYMQGAVRFLWVTLAPGCAFIATEAEAIMGFVYSAPYVAGGGVLRILFSGFGLFAFMVAFLTMLKARGELYCSVGIVFAILCLLLLLNLSLIPIYGPIGAASALTLSTGIGTLITAVLVSHRFGKLITPSTIWRVVLATTLMALVAFYVPVTGWLLLPKGVGLITGYVLVLMVLGELKLEELHLMRFWRREGVHEPL